MPSRLLEGLLDNLSVRTLPPTGATITNGHRVPFQGAARSPEEPVSSPLSSSAIRSAFQFGCWSCPSPSVYGGGVRRPSLRPGDPFASSVALSRVSRGSRVEYS